MLGEIFAAGFILIMGSVCIGCFLGSWLVGVGIFFLGWYLYLLKDLFD
jgi:hypothetical protein